MCGCNKEVKPKGYITQSAIVIRNLWERTQREAQKAQLEGKPTTVKQINKP